MPGKKKATGMSTRQSFLDRNVIAENNAIMRFNEDIENAARGISRPRTTAHDRGRAGSSAGAARPPRLDRSPRAARPPALLPDQAAALRTTVAAAADDEALAGAGAVLVESLSRGDRFERAGDAGWRALVEDAAAGGRTLQEWDRLRLAWTAVRRAALTEWVKIHPDAGALQEREEKAAARTERAANRRLAPRRSRPRRPPSGVPGGPETTAVDAGEAGPTVADADGAQPADTSAAAAGPRRRRPRRRRPRRPASPTVPVGDSAAYQVDKEGEVSPLPTTDPIATAAAGPPPPAESGPAVGDDGMLDEGTTAPMTAPDSDAE